MAASGHTLRRILLWIALACGVPVAAVPPVRFFLANRFYEIRDLQREADAAAQRVARYAYVQGPLWRFHQQRLDDLITTHEGERRNYFRNVLANDGRTLTEQGVVPTGITVVGRAPVVVDAETQGWVEFKSSLDDLLFPTALIAALSGLFGLFVFAVVYFLPVRALDRTLAALRATNAKLADQVQTTLSTYRVLEEHDRQLEETNAALEREHAKAEAASTAKSEFLANMSHELRTPLNAVIGFSEMMRAGVAGPIAQPKYCEYVEHINNSATHLIAVINDILDLSRIEAGKAKLSLAPLEAWPVAEECRGLLSDQATKAGLELVLEADATAGARVTADRTKLKQALINLVANAIKFTGRGGTVTVSVRRAGTGAAHAVEFAVADTGIGMRTEDIPLALERFRQVDGSNTRKFGGAGLGLPITKLLTELHGGTLSIASTPGRGTTVTMRLAAAAPAAPPSPQIARAA